MLINLTKKGRVVLIDDEDYEYLSQFNWHMTGAGYVFRMTKMVKGERRTILMHREIMGVTNKLTVDHINGNSLDNRRINLRICSLKNNLKNKKKFITNTSGYKGVSWCKRDKKWQVMISIDGRNKNIGKYNDLIEAAKKYDTEAKRVYGEYAKLNFMYSE